MRETIILMSEAINRMLVQAARRVLAYLMRETIILMSEASTACSFKLLDES